MRFLLARKRRYHIGYAHSTGFGSIVISAHRNYRTKAWFDNVLDYLNKNAGVGNCVILTATPLELLYDNGKP